jgi:Ser-tRNA(Ala) deacylase AlaX
VTFVLFANGEVRHSAPDPFKSDALVGQKASLQVGRVRRPDNAGLHTGGHLIGYIFETIYSQSIPMKGYHFPDGAYVEFFNDYDIDGSKLIVEADARLEADLSASLDVSPSNFEAISAIRPALAPFTPK